MPPIQPIHVVLDDSTAVVLNGYDILSIVNMTALKSKALTKMVSQTIDLTLDCDGIVNEEDAASSYESSRTQ